ncbi:hypothetical protein AB2T19_000745 [Clostridium botulinum]
MKIRVVFYIQSFKEYIKMRDLSLNAEPFNDKSFFNYIAYKFTKFVFDIAIFYIIF